MIDILYDHVYETLAAYMFLALALLLFTGFPVGLVLGGVALIFAAIGIGLDIMAVPELYLFVDRLWQNAAENQILVAVPCFVFMGTMLERSRVAADLLHILQVLMRRVPGGLAVAVTAMGTIMAATTGIIGASVVMMTLMALPTMLAQRYNTPLATGTIAASATLGILIPPSIMLVIMADLLAVSVGTLFMGAIVPGLVLSALYCVYILIVSTLRRDWAPPLPPEEGAGSGAELLGAVLRGFVPPVILISLVLGSIFAGWATPTEASGVGAFGAVLLAWFNRRLDWKTLDDVCFATAKTSAMIFLIFAGATAFSYVFRALYGEDLILDFIAWLNVGPWGLLLLLMAVIFVLGFFFDWIEITLIILPVFAPVIAGMAPTFAAHLGIEGMEPGDQQQQVLYWFAILVAINLQTSFLTPPFGFALFFLKGAAPDSVRMQDIYKGIAPFVVVQLIGLLTIAFFPQLALYLPNLVFAN